MKKSDCKEALEIYKRFLTRVTKIGEFMKLAEVRYNQQPSNRHPWQTSFFLRQHSPSFLFLELGCIYSLQNIMVINCTQNWTSVYSCVICMQTVERQCLLMLVSNSFSFNRRLESTKTTSPTSTMWVHTYGGSHLLWKHIVHNMNTTHPTWHTHRNTRDLPNMISPPSVSTRG